MNNDQSLEQFSAYIIGKIRTGNLEYVAFGQVWLGNHSKLTEFLPSDPNLVSDRIWARQALASRHAGRQAGCVQEIKECLKLLRTAQSKSLKFAFFGQGISINRSS